MLSRFSSSNLLLVVLCGVLFLDGLDVSMVGVALPSINADLHLTTSQLQWIVSGYVLGYGGLLLLGGRTADLVGRRRTLLVALGLFTVASALGGLVTSGTLLIVTRFLKGAAAAFTAPAGLSIITTTFAEGPERNRALSIYTATGASGFSLGLVLGGLLTELGWRWTFLLPVPIAIALLAVGRRVIPHDRGAALSRRRFDVPGAVTLTTGMLLLVRTIVEAPDQGWASAQTIGAFALSAILLSLFVAIERRSAAPLVRLGILRSSSLVRANLGMMTMFGAYVGFQFVMTLYLQTLNGWSAIETALAFLPAGLLVALVSTRIGPIVDRGAQHRRCPFLRPRDPADDAAARHRLRAQLPDAEHRRDQRRGRPRAGPGVGARADLVPGRRRDRAGRRQRHHHRPRRRLDRHRRDPRRLPDGARRRHRRRGRRAGDRAVGAAPAARGRCGHGRLGVSASSCSRPRGACGAARAGHRVCGCPYLEHAGWPRRHTGRQTGSCAHAHTEGH